MITARGSNALPSVEHEAVAPRYCELRYCPRCGAEYRSGDFQPDDVMFMCAACGFDHYQNPAPSAVVVVADPANSNAVLVLRRRTPPAIGCWCLPGGFIRYGEVPQAAAEREAREETGVEIDVGPVLRVATLDYMYAGRSICVLEVVFVATLRDAGASLRPTAESLQTAFVPVKTMLAAPGSMAFPEHLAVLRDYVEYAARRQ